LSSRENHELLLERNHCRPIAKQEDESMEGASKRARAPGLEATVTTVTIPGIGPDDGIFVLADGTRLVTAGHHILLQIAPSGRLATIAGYAEKDKDAEEIEEDEEDENENMKGGFLDARGTCARFKDPCGMTVDRAGSVVVLDNGNNAIR